jgi:2-polyprenyl-6-methoxyphenol hydroxylase-like FAD-dependent oxidoreductase
MNPTMAGYDVVIVGTRCAGAALAMLLARKGHRVLGLDRARFPSDTVSTHFLWPRTTHFLDTWGLLDRLAATGCPPIDTVNLHFGEATLRGRPGPVEGTAAMYCPRRTVLDHLLVTAARDANAEIRERCVVRDLIRDGDRVIGLRAVDEAGDPIEARAGLVVGADGVFSTVARLTGATVEHEVPSLTGGYYAYWRGVPTDGVEFYIRHGRDNLVFPTHDGLTCVWAGRSHREWDTYRGDVEATYMATLDPALLARVRGGERATPFRGTGKLPNFYRGASGPGWALVGDAAYHRDPLTGMGIGDAFLGASLLAGAVDCARSGERDALSNYGRELRERTETAFDYTVRAASLADPAPQGDLYRRIAQSLEATQAMMNVMAGTQSFRAFFTRDNLTRMLRS